jgi:predicted aspartyl protease
MNGHVDGAGRALVHLRLTSAATATSMEVAAWIDTGFTGELVLPQDQIAVLGLPHSAVVTAELGDGSATMLEVYSCLVEWFGRVQQIEVIANTDTSPCSASDCYKATGSPLTMPHAQ